MSSSPSSNPGGSHESLSSNPVLAAQQERAWDLYRTLEGRTLPEGIARTILAEGCIKLGYLFAYARKRPQVVFTDVQDDATQTILRLFSYLYHTLAQVSADAAETIASDVSGYLDSVEALLEPSATAPQEPATGGKTFEVCDVFRAQATEVTAERTDLIEDGAGNVIIFDRKKVVLGKKCILVRDEDAPQVREAAADRRAGEKIDWFSLRVSPACYISATETHPSGAIKAGEVESHGVERRAGIGTFDQEGRLQEGRVEIRESGQDPQVLSEGTYDSQERIIRGKCILRPATTGRGHPEDAEGEFAYDSNGKRYITKGQIRDLRNYQKIYQVDSGDAQSFKGKVSLLRKDGSVETTIEGEFKQEAPYHSLVGRGKLTRVASGDTLEFEVVKEGALLKGTEKDPTGAIVKNGYFWNQQGYAFLAAEM